MVLDKFHTHFDGNKYIHLKNSSKTIKTISPVPLIMKFHGESDSDNPRIDLYKKNIIFNKTNEVKMGVYGPLYTPF